MLDYLYACILLRRQVRETNHVQAYSGHKRLIRYVINLEIIFRHTLTAALKPLRPSVELAKLELSRSRPKTDNVPVVSRDGVIGRDNEAW